MDSFPFHMFLPPSDAFARKLGPGSPLPQMPLVLRDSSLPCIASPFGSSRLFLRQPRGAAAGRVEGLNCRLWPLGSSLCPLWRAPASRVEQVKAEIWCAYTRRTFWVGNSFTVTPKAPSRTEPPNHVPPNQNDLSI